MFTFIEKSTGKEIDGSLFFLDNKMTDGLSASINSIFDTIKKDYDVIVK